MKLSEVKYLNVGDVLYHSKLDLKFKVAKIDLNDNEKPIAVIYSGDAKIFNNIFESSDFRGSGYWIFTNPARVKENINNSRRKYEYFVKSHILITLKDLVRFEELDENHPAKLELQESLRSKDLAEITVGKILEDVYGNQYKVIKVAANYHVVKVIKFVKSVNFGRSSTYAVGDEVVVFNDIRVAIDTFKVVKINFDCLATLKNLSLAERTLEQEAQETPTLQEQSFKFTKAYKSREKAEQVSILRDIEGRIAYQSAIGEFSLLLTEREIKVAEEKLKAAGYSIDGRLVSW